MLILPKITSEIIEWGSILSFKRSSFLPVRIYTLFFLTSPFLIPQISFFPLRLLHSLCVLMVPLLPQMTFLWKALLRLVTLHSMWGLRRYLKESWVRFSRHFSACYELSKTQIQLLGAGTIAPDIICIPGMSIQVPENCRPVGKWCNLWFHLAHEFPVALLIDCQNCSLSLLWNQRLNICNLEGSIGS